MAKQVYTTGQILTAAQMTTLQANDYNQTVSAKTASYTLVAADAGTRITMSNAGATAITVNTAVFTAGDTLEITNIGAGVCTITAGTATVSTSSTLALKQYDSGQLYFTSTGVAIFFASDAADSPLTTKGDLFTFSTTNDRLAVGANDLLLTAASGETTGLKYTGAWTTFTPTFSGFTLGNGTVDIAQYLQIGKIVFVRLKTSLGSTSSVTGQIAITAPIAGSESNSNFNGMSSLFDTGTNNYSGTAQWFDGVIYLAYFSVVTGLITRPGTSATLPFTWANTDLFQLFTWYKAA